MKVISIAIFFRQLRSLFPPPEIGENGIVGYSQYFGYPFYFETIVFLAVIISPFLAVLIVKYLRKQ